MQHYDNESRRFGSAQFAQDHELLKAGFFKQTSESLFIGFLGKRPLWYLGAGGLLMQAGARGGKLSTILGYNLCHSVASASNFVVLDMKAELTAISQDQTPDRKFCIYWSPIHILSGLPQHHINPLDYIRSDSPSLVSDVKVFCENMVVASRGNNSEFFIGRAREFVEAIALTLVERDKVLTFPALYEAVSLIPAKGEKWLDFAWLMNQSGFPISKRIEEEIARAEGQNANAGGFQGILGEVFKAFACLSDPALMVSVSPPYDFSFEDLCKSEQRYQVYLCCPAEYAQSWSPVLKSMFVAGMIYKARNLQAPRQTWILDECAQLGRFPLVPKLFTYGAGIGIRPWAIYQSSDQMKLTGQNAETIIPASAALRSYFAVRDLPSAQQLSHTLGIETLEYDDTLQQAQSRHARQQAVRNMLGSPDPISAGLDYLHHAQAASHRTQMNRYLRTPDEILNTPSDKQYIFTDGLSGAIYSDRRPYYEEQTMAGRYHPNPYHPPLDHVRVRTAWGFKDKPVHVGPVAKRFAHYPQYKNGLWSQVR